MARQPVNVHVTAMAVTATGIADLAVAFGSIIMRVLFLLFILVPIVEMVVLIKVGQAIGTLWTVGLVLLTAFLGINILRQQGLSTLSRARWRVRSGQLPVQEMLTGILLAVGGALLLTPGFITDTFGFICLFPWSRHWLLSHLLGRFQNFLSGSDFKKRTDMDQHWQKNTTIEGESQRRHDDRLD
jgi:UPF0716 protein FxsA